MLISVFSPKGGSGTTVSSVLFARSLIDFGHVTYIDAHDGDGEIVLGLDESSPYSFVDWLCSVEPTSESLQNICIDVTPNLACVRGEKREFKELPTTDQIDKVVDSIKQLEGHCVVDLGTRDDPVAQAIVQASDVVALVMRPCYLALCSSMKSRFLKNLDVCVVIREQGRTITTRQIANALAVPAVVEIEARRDFARVIDAGVLVHRTPENLIKPFIKFLDDVAIVSDISDVFSETEKANNREFWMEGGREQFFEPKKSRYKTLVARPYTQHARSVLRGRP